MTVPIRCEGESFSLGDICFAATTLRTDKDRVMDVELSNISLSRMKQSFAKDGRWAYEEQAFCLSWDGCYLH